MLVTTQVIHIYKEIKTYVHRFNYVYKIEMTQVISVEHDYYN